MTGQIVIIAAERDRRPNQFLAKPLSTSKSQDASNVACQFCAAQMQTPPILARFGEDPNNVDSWQVCVVSNLYPSLTLPSEAADSVPHREWSDSTNRLEPASHETPDHVYQSIVAEGFHEVIIESPTHETRASDLPESIYQHMLAAYRDRMKWMYEQGAKYVQVIKNSGEAAGASVRHTHSQVFGIPFVPEHMTREIEGAATFFRQHSKCVFCEILERELVSTCSSDQSSANLGSRVIKATDDFVAWCPFASRVGYELHIAPRIHSARFEKISDSLLKKLASFLRTLVTQLDQHPRINAFNYLIHSLPPGCKQTASYHWHIEVLPRIAKQAGFEWGTGVHINTISPEQAAKELRS